MSFDDQIRQALERALTGARGHLEADLRAFAVELVRAAAEERARAMAIAAESATADVRRQAQAQLAHFHETAQRHTDELRRSSEELRRSTEVQLVEMKRALDEGRRAVDEAEQRISQADQRLTQAEQRAAQAEQRAGNARSIADQQIAAARTAADQQVAAARGEVEAARKEVDVARAELEEVRRSAATEAKEMLGNQLAAAAARAERHMADAIARTRTDGEQAMLAHTARIADAVRALDDARTLSEALDTLCESASREAERVALMVVRNGRLIGWRLSGFADPPAPARTIDLSLEDAGLAGDVVKHGVTVSRAPAETAAGAETALPPFAGDAAARHALAVPVTIGGSVIAVLYADAPRLETAAVSGRWPAMLDVLARHASRALEALTIEQATGLGVSRGMARHPHESMGTPQ